MLDLEIMAWRPRLGGVAERSDDSKGIVAKQLTFLTITEPAQLTGRSHCAITVNQHTVISRRHVEHL